MNCVPTKQWIVFVQNNPNITETRQAMYYNVPFRCFHVTIAALEMQQRLHILSVSEALGVQYAMHRRHIAICVVCDST
jgi:hypothetical protein